MATPVPIRCKLCGELAGSMEAPTPRELRAMLADTPFKALAGMIPPNVAAELAAMPIFVCLPCTHAERKELPQRTE